MRGEDAALSCASVSKDLLTLGTLKRSDGDDISITNMTNVFRVKRKKSLSSPGRSNKLDFHGVRRE
jgi:Cu/Ag efflux protein CusF